MKQLLIIDPDNISLNLSKRFLENHGYRVLACNTAEKALEILEKPGVDLVLSEINLVNLDGFDLCTILTKYQMNTPLVFLSNRDDSTTKQHALNVGALSFISKKSEYAFLPRIISDVLSEKSVIRA